MAAADLSAPLRIYPRVSRRFAGITLLIHGGALGLLPFNTLSLFLNLSLALLILAHAAHVLDRYVFMRHFSLREWVLIQDRIVTPDGREAAIAPETFIHPQLVVLNMRFADGRYAAAVLFADALDSETFRRLRVRLRYLLREEEEDPLPSQSILALPGRGWQWLKEQLQKV